MVTYFDDVFQVVDVVSLSIQDLLHDLCPHLLGTQLFGQGRGGVSASDGHPPPHRGLSEPGGGVGRGEGSDLHARAIVYRLWDRCELDTAW